MGAGQLKEERKAHSLRTQSIMEGKPWEPEYAVGILLYESTVMKQKRYGC